MVVCVFFVVFCVRSFVVVVICCISCGRGCNCIFVVDVVVVVVAFPWLMWFVICSSLCFFVVCCS